jgi:hypothetical protein
LFDLLIHAWLNREPFQCIRGTGCAGEAVHEVPPPLFCK